MENQSVAEEAPAQMCGGGGTHDEVEAQSARSSIQCDKPHFSFSSVAVHGACTTFDVTAFNKTSDLQDAPPFCIRGYVAAVREINLSKCWPFSQKLLEESIKEGRHPLLPPLSPCGCVVQITEEYYHDEIIGSADEDMDEACGGNDGPQIQVQIDLSKCEPEICAHAGVDTMTPLMASPSKPQNPSSDAGNSQETQTPCSPHKRAAPSMHAIPFLDGALVSKKQAPRSIREIRKSIMQGCRCFRRMDTPTSKNDACSECPSCLQDRQNKYVADHENVSDITQQESSRKEREGGGGISVIESPHLDVSPDSMCESLKVMQKGVHHIPPNSNRASVPVVLQAEMCENTALIKNMPAHARSEYTTIRASVSDSQSVDKSLESHNSKSSASRPFSDHLMQQDSFDRMPCLDNIPQQRCPVCLLFQSSSNTALNAHIDHCLAVSSTEGVEKTKSKLHRAKVRKKRSMAELCLVAPPCANVDKLPSVGPKSVSSKQTKESTSVGCIKRQKAIKKQGPEDTHTPIGGPSQKKGDCKLRSQAKALKFLHWKSRASSSEEQQILDGACKRDAFQETGIPSIKNKGFLGRTLEWKTKSVLRKTRNWKRQKVNHESVAEVTHNVRDVQDRKAHKLRTLLQRDRNRHNQDLVKHAMPCQQVKDQTGLSGSALPKERKLQNSSNGTAKVIMSDTLMTVIGSRETTLEFLQTDDHINDEVGQDVGNVEKVQFRVHIKPGKKRKNKCQQRTTDDLHDASNLQLAIIRIPSIPPRNGPDGECTIDRGRMCRDHSPMQTQAGRADELLETEIPSQADISKHCTSSPRILRRVAEEWSIQDPSLPLFSSMIEEPQGKARNLPNSIVLETSSPENNTPPFLNSAPPFLNLNKSGGSRPFECTSICLRDTDDVSMLSLGTQSNRLSSLHNHPTPCAAQAWHSLQKESRQIQVTDCQQAQASVFLSTTLPAGNNISKQHYTGFPFSLCMTERAQWPREENIFVPGSEDLNSSIPANHFIQPLQVAQITGLSGTSSKNQEFVARHESLRRDILMAEAGRHVSILRQNAEAQQIHQSSTQSLFRKDRSTAQNSSFQASSRVETWQAQNLPQKLPPWMQAAIQDQTSPDFTSMGVSANSISQSCVLNATRNMSAEVSRGSSMFDMIGNPVLRLMGKTMVLMPEPQQGQVDLTANHFTGQSNYINFLQSLDPGEVNHTKQWNDSRVHTQPGIITQDYLSPAPMSNRRNNRVQSWVSSESRSIPQLQDFIMRTPLSQNGSFSSANQRSGSSQLSGRDISTQDVNSHPLHPRGSPNLLSTTFHRAHTNCQQHQNPTPFQPGTSLFCQHNKSMSSSGFSESRMYNSFNSMLPRVHANGCNSTHAVQNVHNMNTQDPETIHSSPFPSWLSSVSRTDKAYQPAKVIVLDDEDALCSFDTSAPGPLGQAFTKPAVPTAVPQTPQNHSAEAGARIPDSHHPVRERPNNKTFIPIIYTVGGSFGESPFFPGITGSKLQFRLARDRECRRVQNPRPLINTRKRGGSVQQQGRARIPKTSGVVSPTGGSNGTDGNVACNVLPPKSCCNVKQFPSLEALRAAAERMQGSGGSRSAISVPEKLVSRNTSRPLLNKGGEECQAAASPSKGSSFFPSPPPKLHTPTIGMCSINMNPAEVDCQDAGQFMSMPPSMSSSIETPVHNGQPCTYAHINLNTSSRSQPILQSQELGFSNSPPRSFATPTENMQGSESLVGRTPTSFRSPNLLSETSKGKPGNKDITPLPAMIYDSLRKPSPCGALSTTNAPFSFLPDSSPGNAGMPQECSTSRIRSSFEATAPSHGMQSLKVTGKFVIMNGRVSLMDAQKDKGSMAQAHMVDVQNDAKGSMHANAMDVQKEKAVMHAHGPNQDPHDQTHKRSHNESVAKAPGNIAEEMVMMGM